MSGDSTPPHGPAVIVWGAAAVATSWFAYLSITDCFFFADDFLDLFMLGNGSFRRFLLSSGGGHIEPVRNLIFLAQWMAFRSDPAPYFWSALLLHAAVVTVVFLIALRCGNLPGTAALVAILFGTSRSLAGALEWLSVAGQVMASLLVGATLLDVVDRTLRGTPINLARVAGWAGLMFAASMCFGSGTAVALAFPVLLILLPRDVRQRGAVVVAIGVAGVVTLIWFATVLPGLLETLAQATNLRLPSPAESPSYIVAAWAHLLGAGMAGLTLGPWFDHTRYPNVLTTAAVGTMLLVLVLALLSGRGASRRLLLGFIVLTCAAYGVTAVARAPFYHAIRPNMPMATVGATPRYHYLPQLLLALQLAIAFGILSERFARFGRALALVSGGLAVAWMALVWRSPPAVKVHAEQHQSSKNRLAAIRSVTTRHPPGSTVYIRNRDWDHGLGPMAMPDRLPGLAALYITFADEDEIDGRHVRFAAMSDKQLSSRVFGGRIARLLVPPNPSLQAIDIGPPEPFDPYQ